MLTLIIDDIKAGLNQCLQSTHPWYSLPFGRGVDAWFLDGFAPRLNPDMWAVDVFERIAQLSHSQTTLATFTAVGEVQRQLKASGFVLEKVSGFANKREMLRGLFHPRDTKSDKSPIERRIKRPIPWSVLPLPTNSNKAIVIIGAGLAGCHSARALADCGWQVELLESSGQIADGGSGNAQGVVYAKLSVDDDALAQFNLNALLVAEQCYQPLWQRHPKLGQACGVLQLASNEKELRVWQQCLAYFDHQSFDYQGQSEYASAQFLNPKQASELAGTSLDVPALYFPVLGWVNPQALCRHLIDHPNIKVTTRCQIDSLAWDDGEYCWQLLDEHSQILRCSEQVLIANAYNASQFFQTRELPLKKIRGQVSYLSGSDCIDKINTVICGERYIAPLFETATGKQQSVGATFNLHYQQLDIRQQDHRDNIDGIVALLPGLASQLQDIDQSRLTGRASFRCTTPDYLPIVGPVHRHRAFVEDYGKLRVNANTSVDTLGQYWPGLTINVGHGSRGLAYTPLCARLLAAQINGDPLPVSRSLMQALHPGRFTLRALIRRQI
jgi:tRNA 5-methylaminomethyl-2-thiouridine biosynthesis bifunctional protein